jgi:V/A-type H+-transporting ATPase subunit I
MQTPMLKYSFLVYYKEYADFLTELRELGLLHVVEKQGVGLDEALLEKSLRYKKLLKEFEAQLGEKEAAKASGKTGEEIISGYEAIKAERESLQHELAALQKEVEKLQPWGDMDADTMQKLTEAGLQVHLYKCPLRELQKSWSETYQLLEVNQVGSTLYFAVISTEAQLAIEAERVQLSAKSMSQLQSEIQATETALTANEQTRIDYIQANTNNLREAFHQLMQELNLQKVMLNTEAAADSRVMLLEGWCPVDVQPQLDAFLETQSVYFETSEPTPEERVPVKLKNNAFTKLYEFIGELYDLPNYHEIDLTPFFAPFFLLFFGICLGDAGYGLLLIVAAILFKKKVATHIRPIVSGTVFGINLIDAKISWLESAKAYMLDSNKLFYTSLIIGVVQILFGMVIKAIGQVIRYGWAESLSTWGWLILLIGGGGTYLFSTVWPIITEEKAKIIYYAVFALGFLLIFILNNLKRNPFINVGAGIWDSYNMATGLLGDVLSYIRLFALSISGSVMGLVFNDLAISITSNMPVVVSQLVLIFILLFGHGLNIFMSTLGAFVHPMRLTFVEFYKNSGFEGGGKKYRPFANYVEVKKIL